MNYQILLHLNHLSKSKRRQNISWPKRGINFLCTLENGGLILINEAFLNLLLVWAFHSFVLSYYMYMYLVSLLKYNYVI